MGMALIIRRKYSNNMCDSQKSNYPNRLIDLLGLEFLEL